MSLYVDASALVKRYLDEEGSREIEAAMREPDWISSQITYIETLRAISRDPGEYAKAMKRDWEDFFVIDVDQAICDRAVEVAVKHRLKSLDAIHLASALAVAPGGVVLATFDRKLHEAARNERLRTLPTSLS